MCDPSPMAKPGTSKDCIEDNLSRSDVSLKNMYSKYYVTKFFLCYSKIVLVLK